MLNETEGRVVYPYIPTSNRNLGLLSPPWGLVVYPYIPTSNRNVVLLLLILRMLYILIFLHQTATCDERLYRWYCCISLYSYIKPQLTPVIRVLLYGCISLYSYIKPQHSRSMFTVAMGCISLYSYIKPQPDTLLMYVRNVVYPYIPTSNRNPSLWKRFL